MSSDDALYSFAPQESQWSSISRLHLEKAIAHEVPGFDTIRMITEADDPDKVADEIVSKGGKSDYAWSLCFRPSVILRLLYSGFLPICTNLGGNDDPLWVLLPKLHIKRCVLDLYNLHISKKTRKLANKFSLSVGADWEAVMTGCLNQHGENWLYPPLRAALYALSKNPACLRVVSVELWSTENGKLAAGELGVLVGGVYISLSGFCEKKEFPGSGGVQMAALGGWLQREGVVLWDLGMTLPYKLEMGAHEIQRREFLKLFRKARSKSVAEIKESEMKIPARLLIDELSAWQSKNLPN